VGAVRKATGRGVLPMGCFRGRTEEGKKLRHGGGERRFFEAEAGEVGEGWGV
jgi:hypothetical protein